MERLARWLICHCIFWMDGVTKTIASKKGKFRDGERERSHEGNRERTQTKSRDPKWN